MKYHEIYEKRNLNMEYKRICILDTETKIDFLCFLLYNTYRGIIWDE